MKTPFYLFLIDNILVRMRNEEKLGKQEEPTHISVGSKFEDFPIFENCQSEMRTLKQNAINILKIVANMMGSKERQPTMKMSHYPQSRFGPNHNYGRHTTFKLKLEKMVDQNNF